MARPDCGKEINTLPILTGCPADGEYFLVVGAAGGFGSGQYALRSWANLVTCLLEGGIFLVYGDELDNGVYANSDYDNIELVVFSNSINRYLIPVTEYVQISGGGFEVLIQAAWTHEDVFVVFPNGTIV